MPRSRHAVLFSLSTLAVITYLDRLCISIAGPQMQLEDGYTPEQWGWIVGILALSYGGLEIPAGGLGDRFGQRAVITRIVLWWSVFTALTGSVSGFGALLAVRLLFGAGEAGGFPNMSGVISRCYPAGERARAQGALWGSSRLGGVLAPLVVVPRMVRFGWRPTFRILGRLALRGRRSGAHWYRDPPQNLHGGHAGIPWKKLFRSRQLWRIMFMYSLYGWGSYFYLSWLHTYLVKGRGITEKEMGIFSTLPFILGACSNLLGGFLSDYLARRWGLRNGRRVVGALSLGAASLCVLGTALTTDKITGVLLILTGYGCMDLMLPSAWAMCLDLGGRYAGAVSGAMNSSGQVGGFTCSVLFGYLVRIYGNHNTPLFAIALMLLLSAVVFFHIDSSRPIVAEEVARQTA